MKPVLVRQAQHAEVRVEDGDGCLPSLPVERVPCRLVVGEAQERAIAVEALTVAGVEGGAIAFHAQLASRVDAERSCGADLDLAARAPRDARDLDAMHHWGPVHLANRRLGAEGDLSLGAERRPLAIAEPQVGARLQVPLLDIPSFVGDLQHMTHAVRRERRPALLPVAVDDSLRTKESMVVRGAPRLRNAPAEETLTIAKRRRLICQGFVAQWPYGEGGVSG